MNIRKCFLSVLFLLPTIAIAQPTQEEFDALKKRVEKLEVAVYPPQEMKWITSKDGKLWEGGNEFKAWAVNEVGYAVAASTPQQVDARLDSLAVAGVRLVRILHLDSRVGSGTPMWFSDESTLQYNERVLQTLDYFIDGCRKRNIRVWITFFHRRVLTDKDGPSVTYKDGDTTATGTIRLWDELFGNRPSGIYKGEIASLFYFDEVLEKILIAHSIALMDRTNTVNGIKYKDDPTICVVSLANEKSSARVGKGYFVGKNPRGTGSFETAWFARWDEFNARNGGALKGTKHDLAKCWADLDYRVYSRMIDALRSSGVKCVINCTSTFGDCDQSIICGQFAGDILDVHVYPENNTVPDPLDISTDQETMRTLASVLSSARLFDKPIAVSEWGSIYQQGTLARTKASSWYLAPPRVAEWCAQQDVSIVCQYAADSHVLGGPTANNEVYDSFRDAQFVIIFTDAGRIFRETKPFDSIFEKHASAGELFGSGSGSQFIIPVIGSQDWAKQNSTRHLVRVIPDSIPELPWLKSTAWANSIKTLTP